jgi:hypothetical protein
MSLVIASCFVLLHNCSEQQQLLQRFYAQFGVDIAVVEPNGRLLDIGQHNDLFHAFPFEIVLKDGLFQKIS